MFIEFRKSNALTGESLVMSYDGDRAVEVIRRALKEWGIKDNVRDIYE